MAAKEDRDPGGRLIGWDRRLTMTGCHVGLMSYDGTWAAGPGPSHSLQSLLKTDFDMSQACRCQSHSSPARLPGLGVGHRGGDRQTVLVRQADWQMSLRSRVGWHQLEANPASSHILHCPRSLSAPLGQGLIAPARHKAV